MKYRLSRGCYDKFHRCPGWAGGGLCYARINRCPEGGYIRTERVCFQAGNRRHKKILWKWRFYQCDKKCGTIVLPYVTRWLSPTMVMYEIKWKIRDLVERKQLWDDERKTR